MKILLFSKIIFNNILFNKNNNLENIFFLSFENVSFQFSSACVAFEMHIEVQKLVKGNGRRLQGRGD